MNPQRLHLTGTMREIPRDALREVGGGAPPTWSGNPGIATADAHMPDGVPPPAGPLAGRGDDGGDDDGTGGGI